MKQDNKKEQKENPSVQPTNPPAGDLQKKKPSNKTEGRFNPPLKIIKYFQKAQAIKAQVYSMGEECLLKNIRINLK